VANTTERASSILAYNAGAELKIVGPEVIAERGERRRRVSWPCDPMPRALDTERLSNVGNEEDRQLLSVISNNAFESLLEQSPPGRERMLNHGRKGSEPGINENLRVRTWRRWKTLTSSSGRSTWHLKVTASLGTTSSQSTRRFPHGLDSKLDIACTDTSEW
jgi:hypothetical protein